MFEKSDFQRGLAVFRQPSNATAAHPTWIVARGPFEALALPDSNALCVYVNDFSLSDRKPWLRAASWEECDSLEDSLKAVPSGRPRWEPGTASEETFAEDFASTQEALRSGRLDKAVLLTQVRGRAPGDLSDWAAYLLSSLADARATVKPYFFCSKELVIAGITPEQLFESRDGVHFRSHAVAGTQATGSGTAAEFLARPKEAREHELVVEAIAGDLSSLGVTPQIGPRGVRNFGRLEHLETPIEFTAPAIDVNRLIAVLHPSPALGVAPKVSSNLEFLAGLKGCQDRGLFGAPLGYRMPDGRMQMLVAIRNVVWTHQELTLRSGCGVTAESQCDEEWRELNLKRFAVLENFGLAP